MSRRNSRQGKARRRLERAVAHMRPVAGIEELAAAGPAAVLPCGCTTAHELETARLMAALASGMPLGRCDQEGCTEVASAVVYWLEPDADGDERASCLCGQHAAHAADHLADRIRSIVQAGAAP